MVKISADRALHECMGVIKSLLWVEVKLSAVIRSGAGGEEEWLGMESAIGWGAVTESA